MTRIQGGADDFWRTACFMLSAFALFVGGGIGWGFGYSFTRDAQQAEVDAATYRRHAIERDSVASACVSAFDQLSWSTNVALVYTLSAQDAMESFLNSHPQPEIEWSVER